MKAAKVNQQALVFNRMTRSRPAQPLSHNTKSLDVAENINIKHKSPRKIRQLAVEVEAAACPARGLRSSPRKGAAVFNKIGNLVGVPASPEEPLVDILNGANYPTTRSALKTLQTC